MDRIVSPATFRNTPPHRLPLLLRTVLVLVGLSPAWLGAQVHDLPDAPNPQLTIATEQPASPLPAPLFRETTLQQQSPGAGLPTAQSPRPQPSTSPQQNPAIPSHPPACPYLLCTDQRSNLCCAIPYNPYQRFLTTSGPQPLTAKQKAILAYRNVTDPFNFLTITGISALSTAADSHSAYGPGFRGFGYNVGVAYTEATIGSFFGTFAIPALAHQDPHYYRMPNAPVPRRIEHAILSVVWARSDAGTGMINYANIGDTAISDVLGNLYIPGRQTNGRATAERFATALGTDPINTLVTEFLPDVARRINVHIVLIQRIVDEIERQNNGSG